MEATLFFTGLGIERELPAEAVSAFHWRYKPVKVAPPAPIVRGRNGKAFMSAEEKKARAAELNKAYQASPEGRAKRKATRTKRLAPIPQVTPDMKAIERKNIRNREQMRLKRAAERVNTESSFNTVILSGNLRARQIQASSHYFRTA